MLNEKKMDLQLFAEGSSGGATGEGAESASGVSGNGGEEAIQIPSFIPEKAHETYIKAMQKNRSTSAPQKNEVKRTQESSPEVPTVTSEEAKTEKPTFSQLMEDESYKDEREAYLHTAFQRRFKKYDGMEKENATAKRFLSQMAKDYGVDENSKTFFADLEKAQSASESEKGAKELAEKYDLPAEEARNIAETEAKLKENEREKKAQEIAKQELEMRQAQEQLIQQLRNSAEKTKQRFPEFDLDKAMQNEAFRKVCYACGGDTTAAYMATNHENVLKNVATEAAGKASLQVSNAVSANRQRPVENGVQSAAPSVTETSFGQMSKKELAEWFERYKSKGR